MKRKAERITAWVANGLSILFLLLMILVFSFLNVPEFQETFKEMNQQQGVEMSVEAFKTSVIFQGTFLIISTILGIIGTLTIKGNRILAGCMLIIAAITGIFAGNFIALILWFVVAIMLFVRKDPYDGQNQNDRAFYQQNFDEQNNQRKQSEINPENEMKKKKEDDAYIY